MPVHQEPHLVAVCARCGHRWEPNDVKGIPSDLKGLPRICPKCKSVRWNVVQEGT
jgi:Zn finger protein HypA/HybF involved in hydrogenase expression